MTTQLREKRQELIKTDNSSSEADISKIDNTAFTSERGNTKTLSNNEVIKIVKKSIKDFRGRKWAITLNNYKGRNEINTITQHFKGKKWLFIIGIEGKDKEKTPHLQIYIESKSGISFKSLKKFNDRFHLEKAKGSQKENYIYCSKEGDFITNIKLKITKADIKASVLEKTYKNVEWRPFQKDIIKLCENKIHSSRLIHWYYDNTGNIGKSFLCKYIKLRYSGVIIGDGKKADVFNQVNNMLNEGEEPRICIMDIPRYSKEYINYGVIEQIKNGFLYSGKYEGGDCIFHNPLVIIFSNDKPNFTKWSLDRYYVFDLENNKKLDSLCERDLKDNNLDDGYHSLDSDEYEDDEEV